MKRIFFVSAALLLLLMIPGLLSAQTLTTVTATVLDPNGIAYANGTVTFTLVNASGVPSFASTPQIGGSNISGFVGPVGLSATGVLSVNLPCNSAGGGCTVITPAGTQWIPTVCASPAQLPIGTGQGCFTTAGITITGATQDISATLNASALNLAQKVSIARIYNTTPAAGTASIGATTMVTAPAQPAAGTHYQFRSYATQTVLGTSCTTNTTVVVNVIFQDPNAAGPQTVVLGTFSVTNNGTLGIVPVTSGDSDVSIVAKPGTVVQFSTTYTAGANCAPAPTVQVFPNLIVL